MDLASSNNPGQPLTHEQFMRLFLQAERELLRYVMALVPNVSDARDVVQETAVALWQAIEKYDPAKPFVPWACRFALNEARLHLRTESRRRRFIEEDVAAILDERRVEMAGPLDARREHLRDCLSRLPDEQRQLVRGYYFEEESIDALAVHLGRGAEAIYKSLQRIRQALHQCIERKLQTEGYSMNTNHQDLIDLIHACLDGRATDGQSSDLNAKLRADAPARDLYLQLADTHSCLAADERLWVNNIADSNTSDFQVRPARPHWFSWRPLAAAAAGIVFGMLCTSVVFAYVAPSLGKVTTLLQEGFESNSVKSRGDFPSETGVWGGGLARVVQGVDGVAPPEGRQMLRVEPDAAATLTYLDRIIDLSSLPLPAAGEVRYVEVTASFHAGAGGLRDRYTLRAAAFGEAPGSLRQLWLKVPWRELEERTLAGAKRGLSTDADTTGWHKITVRVEAPPEARSIVISLAAGLFETPDLKTAHYIDDVCAHLVITPSTTHPRNRRR